MVILVLSLRKRGNWYHISDTFMEISHFRHIHEADITLISHNGHIHGEGDGGAVRWIPAHVPSVQHLQGPVPLRLADPVVWFQVLGHVTREVPLQRHVGGSNCSTQQAFGNPPLPQRIHQITWHGQSRDREGFRGTTEGFRRDYGPFGVVSFVVSPVMFVEEVKYQGTNQ